MLFNSIEFLIFFPVVTILYFAAPHKYRWGILLFSSCFFYMAFIPVYILILAVTIVIDYFAGIRIEDSTGKSKKIFLTFSILATCAVLFAFKYFNFVNSNLGMIARFFHWNYPANVLNVILPIGLSFHTFQSLSYVIEVYRGNQKAERHFGIYSLYVMFYPQLVAGPIERPGNLLHQFYEKHDFDCRRAVSGLKLMLWGMFKKVVIADRLSILVNQVYGDPYAYTGIPLAAATVFFAFQIYCDFSGYSDIAIGSAEVMGFRLMDNFNRPYFSKSISEFWKRWHISLSTWFKDYFYISLGGNRVSVKRWYFNLFLTFLVSGLWHGANWTFIVWGALNGFYLVFSLWTSEARQKLTKAAGLYQRPLVHKYIRIGTTFSLVCFAWIFFRARSLSEAFYIITSIFAGTFETIKCLIQGNTAAAIELLKGPGYDRTELSIAIVSIFFLQFVHLIQRHGKIRYMLEEKPVWVRWGLSYVLIFSLLYFGVFGGDQFIYFKF